MVNYTRKFVFPYKIIFPNSNRRFSNRFYVRKTETHSVGTDFAQLMRIFQNLRNQESQNRKNVT